MAGEPKPEGGNPTADAFWFFGVLVILIGLWYFSGGPGKADLRGLFLSPPEPLGSGEAYGPQFGESTTTIERVQAPPTLEYTN